MKVGDAVVWRSQSQGCETEKRGKVIAEIPAGQSAMSCVPFTSRTKAGHIKFKDVSQIDRVLVAVPAGKNGQITHYYCPSKAVLIGQGN